MPLVDRLRAHLRKRIPAEDVKLVSPLSGSNQLYWRAAQPASHCDAAGVLADRTEVALRYAGTFENDLVEHGGAIPKVEHGRASRVRAWSVRSSAASITKGSTSHLPCCLDQAPRQITVVGRSGSDEKEIGSGFARGRPGRKPSDESRPNPSKQSETLPPKLEDRSQLIHYGLRLAGHIP